MAMTPTKQKRAKPNKKSRRGPKSLEPVCNIGWTKLSTKERIELVKLTVTRADITIRTAETRRTHL